MRNRLEFRFVKVVDFCSELEAYFGVLTPIQAVFGGYFILLCFVGYLGNHTMDFNQAATQKEVRYNI